MKHKLNGTDGKESAEYCDICTVLFADGGKLEATGESVCKDCAERMGKVVGYHVSKAIEPLVMEIDQKNKQIRSLKSQISKLESTIVQLELSISQLENGLYGKKD